MENTKEALNEGIAIVASNPIPATKDIYNITSSNTEVLRLEICKLQRSEETIKDCLTVQQQNLNAPMNLMGAYITVGLALIVATCGIMMTFRSRK